MYQPKPGDDFDYSDFQKLIDPQEIKWTVQVLRNIVAAGSEAVILTARAHQGPVLQFLQDAGLPPLEVIALANSEPQKKADYIAMRIEQDDLDFVEFFDDSPKNVAAVQALQSSYPNTKIISRQVVGGH